MNIRKHIPNSITCLNLLCGVAGIIALLSYNAPIAAFCFMLAGAGFDFCDGLSARLLNAYSPVGKELDSLADDITFGALPALMMHEAMRGCGMSPDNPLCWIPLLITAFSALRLAKFNVDPEQAHSFKGLASPANAMFVASIPLIDAMMPEDMYVFRFIQWAFDVDLDLKITLCLIGLQVFVYGKWFIMLPMALFFAAMMVSNLPMFSLKLKHFSYHENKTVFKFLIFSAIMLLLLQWVAVPMIILAYIIISVANRHKNQE